MSAKILNIIAVIKAKAGKESETKAALEGLVGPTRAEEGCIDFDLYENTDDTSSFMFYENWMSREALSAHMQAPHIKAFGEKASGLLAEPIKATFWEKVNI
jgi:quinol monooxygenase YgiN